MATSVHAARSVDEIDTYCGFIGVAAGGYAQDPSTSRAELMDGALYISRKTAFDLSETKSRINDITKNASLRFVLTPADIASHTYFWCVYDLIGIEPGTKDAFEIESNSLEMYQTIFNQTIN